MRYVALFVVLGLLLGIGVSQARNAGYFEQWQQTASPPVKIEELITSGKGTILAKTIDGEILRCTNWREECWIPAQLPSPVDDAYVTIVTKPCDFSSPEFSLLTNRPREIIDCIQDKTTYADGWGEQTYVLDADGVVWEWSHGGTVYSAGGGHILFSCLGMLLGVCLGGGIVWWKRRKND